MPTPSIRRATAADATALSAFAARLFPLGCPPDTAPSDLDAHIAAELSPARFLALIADPNAIFLIAESSSTIAAYVVALRSSPHPQLALASPAELRKLYLDPAYHGSGLADRLMQSALAILHAEGSRPIWLSVFSENPRAIAFYQKWGFQIAGSQEYVVGTDHQKDFLMLRDSLREMSLDPPTDSPAGDPPPDPAS